MLLLNVPHSRHEKKSVAENFLAGLKFVCLDRQFFGDSTIAIDLHWFFGSNCSYPSFSPPVRILIKSKNFRKGGN
ncbi:MAG: hypothetical protein ACRC62_10100 [Microcoleus sp.]